MNNKVIRVVDLLKPLLFKRDTLEKGSELHHFGGFNKAEHTLTLPIWVSDSYEKAKEYENFGVRAHYYSVLVTTRDIALFDLNGVSLFEIAMSIGAKSHKEWNQILSEALDILSIEAFVYAGREIFVGSPEDILVPISSVATIKEPNA